MGIGSARGDNRAVEAAERAISSPLLEQSMDGARGVLLSIAGGSDLGLFEINDAAQLVTDAAHSDANIIFGAVIDDALGDEVRVTVIAAGFDGGAPAYRPADAQRRSPVLQPGGVDPGRHPPGAGAAPAPGAVRRCRRPRLPQERRPDAPHATRRRELTEGRRPISERVAGAVDACGASRRGSGSDEAVDEVVDRGMSWHRTFPRYGRACRPRAAAGRDPGEVTLIAVTKTFPGPDVLPLAALGVADIGENRDQEAATKAAQVAAAGVDVRWHFIGQLQRNKSRSVVRYADLVHSVDSVRLAAALAEAVTAAARRRRCDVLVQVSLDGDAGRGGALVDGDDADTDLDRVLERVAGHAGAGAAGADGGRSGGPGAGPGLRHAGVDRGNSTRRTYPDATLLSAGMSSDVEQAIDHGATHVRLGSAVLGNRPTVVT